MKKHTKFKHYTQEQKQQIIDAVLKDQLIVADAARKYKIPHATAYNWVSIARKKLKLVPLQKIKRRQVYAKPVRTQTPSCAYDCHVDNNDKFWYAIFALAGALAVNAVLIVLLVKMILN